MILNEMNALQCVTLKTKKLKCYELHVLGISVLNNTVNHALWANANSSQAISACSLGW